VGWCLVIAGGLVAPLLVLAEEGPDGVALAGQFLLLSLPGLAAGAPAARGIRWPLAALAATYLLAFVVFFGPLTFAGVLWLAAAASFPRTSREDGADRSAPVPGDPRRSVPGRR